jgi:carboxymethylenebutenolidase
MKKAGKTYDPVTYEGAGHGFMRTGDEPNASGPDKTARDAAWKRWRELLQKVA